MDWIGQFEEEDKRKAEAQKRAREEQETRAGEEAARFEVARKTLGPILKEQAAEVERRLGIHFDVGLHPDHIHVRARRPTDNLLTSTSPPNYFEFRDCDGKSVRLRVPDGKQNASLVSVRSEFGDLLAGDLQSLLAWLVANCRGEHGERHLDLRCVQREKQRKEKAERAARIERGLNKTVARVLVLAALASFGYPYFGPVALIGGLFVRYEMVKIGQEEGRIAAACAIGLGGLTSFVLALVMLAHELR